MADAPVVRESRADRARRGLRSMLGSYRLRLLGWFVGLLGLGTIATVLVVGEVVLQGTDERIQRDLVQETQEFASLVRGTDPETGAPFGADIERIFEVFLERNVTARNEVVLTFIDGQFYGRSRPAPIVPLQLQPDLVDQVITADAPTEGRYASSVGAVDYLSVPVRVDGVTRGHFVVAAFRDVERGEQDDIVRAVTTVGLVLLVIGSILAWRLADRVLAPVRSTTATARSINESDLSQRVLVDGDDEVAQLALTFNAMLDRVETAIEEQRRFMSDAGHELRTPLTISRGHLELIDADNAEEVRHTAELVVDEVDRMTRIVNDLTLLAAATRPDFVRRSDLSSAELVRSVFDKARVLADRDWQLVIEEDQVLSGDAQRLTQAMLQLAQNAVQHTMPTDTITIGTSSRADAARLWVRDTGPGIPPEHQAHVFRRFYRVDGEPTVGNSSAHTGLGLAIVRAIAEAHGGGVTLESVPGAGATFTIVVPAETHDRTPRS